MSSPNSLERRLLLVLSGIACVAVLGVVAILPYRLYERDVRHARVSAHRVASVAHAALSNAVGRGEDVEDLLNRLRGIGEFELRLVRTAVTPGSADPVPTQAESEIDGTTLTYQAAPVVGPEGDRWQATMTFDLAPMKRESVRLIIDLMLAVLLGSAVFSGVVFGLVRAGLLKPLREITRRIDALGPDDPELALPPFGTSEMSELAQALERACRTRGPASVP
jgi:hypothetical protein